MTGIAIAMPRLGMTMEEGTVVEWPVALGERVEKGQIVLVIETEKAESEIEATSTGVFRHVYALPGETVPCGGLLAALTEDSDEVFDPDAFREAYQPPEGSIAESPIPIETAAAAAASAGGTVASVGSATRRRKAVAPAARALAKKLEIDVELVAGTGPGGRVVKRDVEAAAAVRERLVSVEDGVGLEVFREGEGDPVVLLPGFGTDISSFALQTPGLSASFEVIGVNPRGVGGSDSPATDVYELGQAADDVAAVLAGSRVRAHVVGASLGAAVAIELALRHPDQIRSLSLITPFVEVTARLASVAQAWIRVAREATPETVAAFLMPWLFGHSLLADDAACARTQRGLAQSVRRIPVPTLERAAAGMAAWSGSRASDLERIQVPVLVLAAGADLLTPDADQVAAAIPGAVCEVVLGCGHALAIDGAETVNRLLQGHLEAS
jgi:pyruvate dehydrogenase E2 component (dihydrolipoamide acetyltransferase)